MELIIEVGEKHCDWTRLYGPVCPQISEGLGTSNWNESTDQMACWSRCQQLERSAWVKLHDSSWNWTMVIGAKGLKYKQMGQLRMHKQAHYDLQTSSRTSQQAGEAWDPGVCAFQSVKSLVELTPRRLKPSDTEIFKISLLLRDQKKKKKRKAFQALVLINSTSNSFHAIKN